MRITFLALTITFSILSMAAEVVHPFVTPATPERYEGAILDNSVKAPGANASMLWEFDKSAKLYINDFPTNFLNYKGKNNAIELWLYAEKPQNGTIILLVFSENPAQDGDDYYSHKIPLDFEGWKCFHFPFTDVIFNRFPLGWNNITGFGLCSKGWELPQIPGRKLRIGNISLVNESHVLGPRITDEQFYSQLDLERPGLEMVREAIQNGDFATAEHALAAYYRKRTTPRWRVMWDQMPTPDKRPKEYDTTRADNAVKHLLTSCSIPHQFGERIDWSINPTKLQYREWTWQLSRHPMWVDLQQAYWATGNETYAKEFNDQMIAWVEDNLVPKTSSGNVAGSRWRTIETGIRTLDAWPTCFFGFLSSPSFTDHGVVTMLKSFYEHGCHLYAHPTKGNWLTMEMDGLFVTATLFPEFKPSYEWQQFAIKKLYDDMSVQIYPDGAQTELAPGYHGVSLKNFLGLVRTAALNNVKLPDDYLSNLEKMYVYYVKIATPDFKIPALNDSGWGTIQGRMAGGFSFFPTQKSFQYIATNRQEGAKPSFTSIWMPYAGWAIMRSGWEENDAYMHFEVGPFSTGHSHEDKLSFVIHAKGNRLLTEAGIYPYDSSQWRRYVLSSYAHNLTLVDKMEQHRRLPFNPYGRTNEPLPNVFITNDQYDFAEGWYNEGYGPQNDKTVTQYRAFLFVKPNFWVMFDIFTSKDDKPHTYETMFHLENAEAKLDSSTLAVTGADKGRTNLAIIPARKEGISVEIVKGQETPVVQGWVPTKEYDVRAIPTPIYTRKAAGQFIEPYILYPLADSETNPVKELAFANNTLTVKLADGTTHTFALKLDGERLAEINWNGTLIKIR